MRAEEATVRNDRFSFQRMDSHLAIETARREFSNNKFDSSLESVQPLNPLENAKYTVRAC